MKQLTLLQVSIDSSHTFTLTNAIQLNTLKWQERVDTAFAEGSCQIITDLIDYNIPPYSIAYFKWLDYTEGTTQHYVSRYFLISSQARKHPQIDGLYVHNCKLLEATAILETFIVGTKTFSIESSFTNDYQRIQALYALMNDKYNLVMYFTEIPSRLTSGNNEYSFGAGTTFFAALSEICLKNSFKIEVYLIEFNNNDGLTLYCDFISTTNNPLFDWQYYNLQVVDYEFNQDSANYCKYLETEAKNVVDRGNNQYWFNLSCRSDGPALDADHAEVHLPCNVEGITNFEVNTEQELYIDSPDKFNINLSNYSDELDFDWWVEHASASGTYYTITGTWSSLLALLSGKSVRKALNDIQDHLSWFEGFDYWYSDTNRSSSSFQLKARASEGEVYEINLSFVDGVGIRYLRFGGNIPVNQQLVEESYWNTLPANQKSTYAVYKSGSNTIYNLNATYKSDFINNILGITTYNFLQQTYNFSYVNTSNNKTANVIFEVLISDNNPLDYTYNVSGIAIINPRIIVEKSTTPINQSGWLATTRSYTNSSNVIDMDNLYIDMRKKVKPLGNIELTITFDTTEHIDPNQCPKPKNMINFNGKQWYVSAVEHEYKLNQRLTHTFLSAEPLKISDAIGVDYQFNPIRLPYYATADRPLYYEYDDSDVSFSYAISQALSAYTPIILIIQSKNSPNDSPFAEVGLRAIVNRDEDDHYNHVLYCEMADNYSAGDEVINVGGGKQEVRAVKYGDSRLESAYISIYAIVLSENINKATANLMPNIDISTFNQYSRYSARYLFQNLLVLKDGRERLTFTIKIKKG